jgi:hypothetical protein
MAVKHERDEKKRPEDREPKHEGDVLGISDATPDGTIPRPAKKGSGAVEGIDVRDRATGIGDVPQRSGATGIDMGAGGEGTHLTEHPSRPKSAEPTEDED